MLALLKPHSQVKAGGGFQRRPERTSLRHQISGLPGRRAQEARWPLSEGRHRWCSRHPLTFGPTVTDL